jgi:hypothetical protein
MALVRIARIAVAAASVSMAGCSTAPSGERLETAGLPLAAAHADMIFMLTTSPREQPACAERANCANHGDADNPVLTPFAAQVKRVAGLLQDGARRLYPGLANNGFDIYVAAGDEPGSHSSNSGRIALNRALGVMRPYDDWLAFVIAREMGHVIARHHEENSSVSIAISVAMNILLPGSGLLKSAASTIGSGFAVSSKRDEQTGEADAIAMKLLQAAGFSLHDVALSLAIAPAEIDAGGWSQGFRKSSDKLITATRGSKFAGTSDPTATSNTR